MDVIECIRRLRTEIGDVARPFQTVAQGDNVTTWVDLLQPNVNPIGFSIVQVQAGTNTTLVSGVDYTVDDVSGQIFFTNPIQDGSNYIIQGTTYGMFSDNELLDPIRDAIQWHCAGRMITERYNDRAGFITYRETPINLSNLPPEEELPFLTLCTYNVYWMLANDMALDVNVQTAEGTSIDRVARYNQVMNHIHELDTRYTDLCMTFNIGPKRIKVTNLRRTSHTTGRLVPLMKPREYDDIRYPQRMLPPIDGTYLDNSGIPSQLFFGAGLL